jgi:hypothetical protein
MSANDIVFGIKIVLNDRSLPVDEDSTIGLFNVNSSITLTAASGQPDLIVYDGTKFEAGQLVYISDDNSYEENVIDSIDSNTITFKDNLTNSYVGADNGLVSADSVFGWTQTSISGITGNWIDGMIVQGGLGEWTRSIDLKQGGNIAQAGSASVTVKNTSKFWNTLFTKNIYMNGCRAEIYKFTGTAASKQWSGICDTPTWNSKEYTINMVGYHNKRIANIGTEIDEESYPYASSDTLGNLIPCTFGKIVPVYNSDGVINYNGFAKCVIIKDLNNIFTIKSYDNINGSLFVYPVYSFVGTESFPVLEGLGGTPPISYRLKLMKAQSVGTDYTWRWAGSSVTYFENKILQVVDGTGEGKFRVIESASVTFGDSHQGEDIVFTLKNYFEEDLSGNESATADNQSWCKILDAEKQYKVDAWPCQGFVDDNEEIQTIDLNFYSYVQNDSVTVSGSAETVSVKDGKLQFLKLPKFFIKVNPDGNCNLLISDSKYFKNSLDTVESYLIIPVKRLNRMNSLTAAEIGESDYTYEVDGLYSKYDGSGGGGFDLISYSESGDSISTEYKDKNYNTYKEYEAIIHNVNYLWYHAHRLYFPTYPTNFSFDNVYLGLWINATYLGDFLVVNYAPRFKCYLRRFFGGYTEIADINTFSSDISYQLNIRNLPEDYFSAGASPSNKDLYFYYANNGDSSNEASGFGLLDLSIINSIDKYKSYYCCSIGTRFALGAGGNVTSNYKIREAAIIFKKNVSVKNEVYSMVKGRIYNNTWGSRKTAANLIESPVDILEHVERLSCWSDYSNTPSAGWGKGYATGAKISTTYFDDVTDPNFLILSTYKCSNQLLNYDDCYTDKIQRSLCKDFFMAKWYDKNGYACVSRVKKSETSPSDTITLADIVDRSSISITEPSPCDIFPEPFVRYRKNFASDKYESLIRVTNASAISFNSAYVQGISDSDEAEILWNKCHVLWLKAGHLEKPPNELTDKQWFNSDGADNLAKDYLNLWVDWMFNPSCQIVVHFNKAGEWEEAHRFTLQLPHQTNDTAIECVITKIKVNPNPPYYVTINAIMFRETIPVDYYIKDTWINFSNNTDDWKDTYADQTGDNDIKKI